MKNLRNGGKMNFSDIDRMRKWNKKKFKKVKNRLHILNRQNDLKK